MNRDLSAEKEQLQDKVWKNYILNIRDLESECERLGLEPYEDVLSGMEYNSCDRCGDLWASDTLIWLDYIDDELSAKDECMLRGVEKSGEEYCCICDKCYRDLAFIGGWLEVKGGVKERS